MALVLSMREGEQFYAGADLFVVQKVYNEFHFEICNMKTGEVYTITDEHTVEVAPAVKISAGDRPPSSTVRMAVSAPRDIKITRRELVDGPRAR